MNNQEQNPLPIPIEFQTFLDALAYTLVELEPTVKELVKLADAHPNRSYPVRGSTLRQMPWPRSFRYLIERKHLGLVDSSSSNDKDEHARREEAVRVIHDTLRTLVEREEENQRKS